MPTSGRIDWRLPGRIIGPLLPRAARWRRRRRGRAQPPATVATIYRTLASDDPGGAAFQVDRARTVATHPREVLEATVASALVGAATGDARRVVSVLAFCEAFYQRADLEVAAARAAERLRLLRDMHPAVEALGPLSGFAGWEAFAGSLRERFQWARGPWPEPAPATPGRGAAPVVVALSGGLGNQLFQWAAAFAFARRIGASLRVQTSNYGQPGAPRELLISRFKVELPPPSRLDMARARRVVHRALGPGPDTFLFEATDGAWMRGYWEDARYFAGCEDAVRERIVPRDRSTLAAARAIVDAARAGSGRVVGVHVRRGDRAPGASAGLRFAALPVAYYEAAARQFPAGSTFLVFSESPADLEWCRMALGGLAPAGRVLFAGGNDAITDLFALAQCDDLVLSGGTFSWWAAWLNTNASKAVVAPDPVFSGGPASAEYGGGAALLEGWTVLPVAPWVECFSPTRRAAGAVAGEALR